MSRIVYTSFDERTPYWKICEPSIRKWVTETCQAQLVNLPAPKDYQPQWVIFDAFRDSIDAQSNSPDEVHAAWIDCDIIARKWAPDIFSAFPPKLFFCPPDPPSRVHPNMSRGATKWGLPNPRPYIITAIVKWTPTQVAPLLAWFGSNRHRFGRRIGDQELITVALYETETFNALFPHPMHRMSKWANKQSSFLHAAGGRKVGKLRKLSSWLGPDEPVGQYP